MVDTIRLHDRIISQMIKIRRSVYVFVVVVINTWLESASAIRKHLSVKGVINQVTLIKSVDDRKM